MKIKGKKMKNNKKVIVGIGSALVDILIHEDDDFLKTAGVLKGGMTYVDSRHIEEVMSRAKGKVTVVPGGSACNTIIGIARLGGNARFIGKLGDDEFGNIFQAGLKNNNVESVIFKSASPTGRVLSIITPDAQRSMLTYLGAASDARGDEITDKCFEDVSILHVEGYLVYNEDLIMAALKGAKHAGLLISLDISNFTVVEEKKPLLEKIVNEFVDILIANEDEARVFTGYSDEKKALKFLSEKADIAVLKVGKRGSFISKDGEVINVKPAGIVSTAVDTTGAGDLWASGFLFGFVNGYPLEECGKIASMCGYEVCQVIGANIPDKGWERIKKRFFKDFCGNFSRGE